MKYALATPRFAAQIRKAVSDLPNKLIASEKDGEVDLAIGVADPASGLAGIGPGQDLEVAGA